MEQKKLLERIYQEEKVLGADPSMDRLSTELRADLDSTVPPEILSQGIAATKNFLNAF